MQKIKIILTIRSLEIGGAERQFIELVKGIDTSKFDVIVCTMFMGSIDYELNKIKNIEFICFNKKNRYDIKSYLSFIKLIVKFKPNIIYSFMTDMNLISLLCSKLSFSKCKLVWGIRASITDLGMYGLFSKFVFKIQQFASQYIDLIIFNSYTSQLGFTKIGYKPKSNTVIQNGFDVNKFYNDPELRKQFREKYGLTENNIVIGITSRLDPIKGYKYFCQSALYLLNKYNNIYFFSIGYGDTTIQNECNAILSEFVNKKFYWLGKQNNPQLILPGWDIYCSASLPGEGFSNAIAEAMLCELTPVVTDSGDSAMIVEGIGEVCKFGNVNDLSLKLEAVISNFKDNAKGKDARIKIVNNYNMENMINKTESEFLKLITNKV